MITPEEVQYVARLARIHLKEAEIKRLGKDLDQILEYVRKLETLDVSDVDPTSHVLPISNVFREDEVKPSLKQEEALSIAVEQKDGSFKVPKVIE